MTAETIPEDVQAFLRDRIRSFEELETLLLLRSEPTQPWHADTVGERLNVSVSIAQEALEQLCLQKIVRRPEAPPSTLYRYDGSDPALETLIDRFVHAYQENRIVVMKLMTRNAVERLRGSAIRTFADAFLVGKKRDG